MAEDLAEVEWRHVCSRRRARATCSRVGISRTIIEQTPTKILFPNPDANAREYIEGFGLSEREFKLHQGAARAGLAAVPDQAGP